MEQRALTEEQEAKIQNVDELVARGSATVVCGAGSHATATELLVQLQTKKREIEDIRDYQLEPIRDTKRDIEVARKRIIEFFQRPLDALAAAMPALDGKMIGWRREERRKAEVKAQKERAAELKKIDAQKKKQRAVADALEKKGLEEDAAELRDQIAYTPAPAPIHVAPRIETVRGAKVKIKKVAEVDNMLQFALLGQAITRYNDAMNKANESAKEGDVKFALVVPAAYWTLNRKALDTFGQKTDGQVAVPGVRWVEDESTGARRRR